MGVDALRLERVDLDYPGNPGVLQGVTFRIPKGHLVVLEGRSGSGKSSILRLAAGLERPTRGVVRLMEEALGDDRDENARRRAKHVGLVFQHLHLLPELSVSENIQLPLRLRQAPPDATKVRTQELIDRFGLQALADARPTRLSGGEQQRVAIARALAVRPDLLLVDEPTSALDKDNALNVIDALQEAARSGAAVLVATHDDLFRDAGPVLRIEDGAIQA